MVMYLCWAIFKTTVEKKEIARHNIHQQLCQATGFLRDMAGSEIKIKKINSLVYDYSGTLTYITKNQQARFCWTHEYLHKNGEWQAINVRMEMVK